MSTSKLSRYIHMKSNNNISKSEEYKTRYQSLPWPSWKALSPSLRRWRWSGCKATCSLIGWNLLAGSGASKPPLLRSSSGSAAFRPSRISTIGNLQKQQWSILCQQVFLSPCRVSYLGTALPSWVHLPPSSWLPPLLLQHQALQLLSGPVPRNPGQPNLQWRWVRGHQWWLSWDWLLCSCWRRLQGGRSCPDTGRCCRRTPLPLEGGIPPTLWLFRHLVSHMAGRRHSCHICEKPNEFW